MNSESEPTDGVIENHKITYTYDAEDKVTMVSYAMVEAGGVESLSFVYDHNRWLESVILTEKEEEQAVAFILIAPENYCEEYEDISYEYDCCQECGMEERSNENFFVQPIGYIKKIRIIMD